MSKDAKEVTVEVEQEIVNDADFKALRASVGSGKTWNSSIIAYLKAHNGCNEIALYDATRPDRLDITKEKKVHNLASQYNYLRNDGFLVKKEDDKVFLLTEMIGKQKVYVKGMKEKALAMLGK